MWHGVQGLSICLKVHTDMFWSRNKWDENLLVVQTKEAYYDYARFIPATSTRAQLRIFTRFSGFGVRIGGIKERVFNNFDP